MPKEIEQSIHEKPASDDLGVLELKANLNPEQREHLEVLKSKMKKVLNGKTKQELAKAGDLVSLKNYRAVLREILEFLKTKEIRKDRKDMTFKTMEELEAIYRPEQIAHSQDEVGEDTKVYIGQLYPGIFDELPNDVEHIYTSFPEGRIMQIQITIGGKTAEELKKELGEKQLDLLTAEAMDSKDFKTLNKKEKIDLVVLSVADLGFPESAPRQEIYDQAQKLGLKLVPAEVGPQLTLQYKIKYIPNDDEFLIGSEPLAHSSGLSVFRFVVHHIDNDYLRWLSTDYGKPSDPFLGRHRWVFARPS